MSILVLMFLSSNELKNSIFKPQPHQTFYINIEMKPITQVLLRSQNKFAPTVGSLSWSVSYQFYKFIIRLYDFSYIKYCKTCQNQSRFSIYFRELLKFKTFEVFYIFVFNWLFGQILFKLRTFQ